MLESEFILKAKTLVYNFAKSSLDPSDTVDFNIVDVYVVTLAFVLGNIKAMLSTTLPDGMYYEVAYNKTKDEIYLVAYKRWQELTVRGEDVGGSATAS